MSDDPVKLPKAPGECVEYKPGAVTYTITLDRYGFLDARCSLCAIEQSQWTEPKTVAYCAARMKATETAGEFFRRIDEHDRAAHQADSPRCDVCGKILEPMAPDACKAGWDYEEERDCDGNFFRGDPRDHARVATLRAALGEALDAWEGWARDQEWSSMDRSVYDRIATLRKLLG